jgi:hypothetical protein
MPRRALRTSRTLKARSGPVVLGAPAVPARQLGHVARPLAGPGARPGPEFHGLARRRRSWRPGPTLPGRLTAILEPPVISHLARAPPNSASFRQATAMNPPAEPGEPTEGLSGGFSPEPSQRENPSSNLGNVRPDQVLEPTEPTEPTQKPERGEGVRGGESCGLTRRRRLRIGYRSDRTHTLRLPPKHGTDPVKNQRRMCMCAEICRLGWASAVVVGRIGENKGLRL